MKCRSIRTIFLLKNYPIIIFTGDLSAFQPNEGVLPYDLNSPLFTDYAEKARFVWMPKGVAAGYDEKMLWIFLWGPF